MRSRSWTKKDLIKAVAQSKSVRQTLVFLNLAEAGGNYSHVKKYIGIYKIDTSHFLKSPWNKGKKIGFRPVLKIQDILCRNSSYQSYKLKRRLVYGGLKINKCEECSWAKRSVDGRVPLELDHINGDRFDNRLENLRVLCPNCHSLKITHRGLNKGKK